MMVSEDWEQYRDITNDDCVRPETDAYGDVFVYIDCPCGEFIRQRSGGNMYKECVCGRVYRAEVQIKVMVKDP